MFVICDAFAGPDLRNKNEKTDQIYHRAAKRRGDKFDRSMTRGKLLGNNALLFIFISILIMTQLISFL